MDVVQAAQVLIRQDDLSTRVMERTLQNNEKEIFQLHPLSNQKITATITWTDPPGKPVSASLDPATLMLVNDLDIRIVDEQGVEQKPWILDPLNPSRQAARGDNFRDNIEKIEFNNPEAKPYKLVVSHKGQLANGRQDYSIILTYKESDAPKIFYWVGGSGDWQNSQHWSLTSGGAPAALIPTENDRVVFDENSFSELTGDQVNIIADVSCRSLLWAASTRGFIDLHASVLHIKGDVKVSSPLSVFRGGALHCENGGKLFWSTEGFQDTEIILTGAWEWKGHARIRHLTFTSGALKIKESEIELQDLMLEGEEERTLTLDTSTVRITHESSMNGNRIQVTATKSQLLTVGDDVLFKWDNVSWPASLQVVSGSLILQGDNEIDRLDVMTTCNLIGSNEITILEIKESARLELSNGVSASVEDFFINSSSDHRVQITGSGPSTINFLKRKKFCFDYLDVVGVNVTGTAVVNAGASSTLSDATGWQSMNCSDVLYADFDIQYPCINAMAELNDLSEGHPEIRTWSIMDPEGAVEERTGAQIKYPLLKDGLYKISLQVKQGENSDQITTEVIPVANELKPNSIVVNAENLVSMEQAEKFQWYKDDTGIENATARSYTYQGNEGRYAVVTYAGNCNRLSDRIVITAMDESGDLVLLFPNPTQDYVNVRQAENIRRIRFVDATGRSILEVSEPREQISLRKFPPGFYFALMETTQGVMVQKLIVQD